MSRAAGARQEAIVLLCRGCCCGTRAKHPRVNHDAQQRALEDAAADHPGVKLRVVDCLDECARSNVAVIRRPAEPRNTRDTWLGGLIGQRATSELASWIRSGAGDPLPPALAALRFRRIEPRRR